VRRRYRARFFLTGADLVLEYIQTVACYDIDLVEDDRADDKHKCLDHGAAGHATAMVDPSLCLCVGDECGHRGADSIRGQVADWRPLDVCMWDTRRPITVEYHGRLSCFCAEKTTTT
jgi:hypothetical protein